MRLQSRSFAQPNGPPAASDGDDGSQAAFLPARRAMTHQLTDTNGAPVVRERYWITYQPEKSVPAPVVWD